MPDTVIFHGRLHELITATTARHFKTTKEPDLPGLSELPTTRTLLARSRSIEHTISLTEIDRVHCANTNILRSYLRLPKEYRLWLWFEQTKNPKIYDPDFFPSMDDMQINTYYAAESRNVLQLAAYRIPNAALQQLTYVHSTFNSKLTDGPGYSLLLVHPSLRNDDLFLKLGFSLSHRQFYFLPAASARTGLTWELGQEHEPFFTKMSIRREGKPTPKDDLGSSSMEEGKVSVLKTAVILGEDGLGTAKDRIFTDERYMQLNPELAHSIEESYGVLFRRIPIDPLRRGTVYIPFFSLASTPTDGSKPILVKLIEESGLSIEEYFNSTIYPGIINFVIQQHRIGVYPDHLHGQNLLTRLAVFSQDYSDKIHISCLIPEVIYRDVNDLKIHAHKESSEWIKLRRQLGQPEPVFTPGAYAYLALTNCIKTSIVPILFAIEQWQKDGMLLDYKLVNPSNHTDLILPLLVKFLNYLEENIYTKASTANSDYNTLCEALSFMSLEKNINQGTRRQRDWLTSAYTLYNYAAIKARTTNPVVDVERYRWLLQHCEIGEKILRDRGRDIDARLEALIRPVYTPRV